MKVFIVGLGMIGASYASKLSKKNYEILGYDINEESIKKAFELGIIKNNKNDLLNHIKECDLIIFCIYPKAFIEFITKYNNLFDKSKIITDVLGVKVNVINEVKKYGLRYIPSHPMAGSEKKGIEARNENIFNNANFLITPYFEDEEGINIIKKIATDMDFGKITVVDPFYHDEIISFTSQLTHALAVSLVNSDKDEKTNQFTGDSYRDLTRIAMINKDLWSELFLMNEKNLVHKIDIFIEELNKIKEALVNNDQIKLMEIFEEAYNKKKRF